MRVLLSVFGSSFNYNDIENALRGNIITELICIKNETVRHYAKAKGLPLQEIEIDWNNIYGIPENHLKTNKWGKLYDGKAPEKAARKAAEYAEAVAIINKGDATINRIAKEYDLPKVTGQADLPANNKKRKF